jgi:hypothetical protein
MHLGWYTPPTGFASSARTPPPVLTSERLMKSREATGSFWRPETSDEHYWGTIAFNPGEGTKLVLEGHVLGASGPHSFEVPVLHGRLFNGAPCSLFSCWCNVESYVTDRQYFRTHVFSPLLICGGHWSDADACRFDRLQIRFSHLDQWFENPYTIRHKRGGFTKSLLTFKPDTLNADFVFKGVHVHLESGCDRSIPTVATPEGARWSYHYHLILQPKSPQLIGWLLDLTSVLREFFVFLIGSGVYTLDLVGISGAVEDNNFQRFEVDHPVTVPAVVRTESRYFSTHHRDYKESLPLILRAWFDRRTELAIAARAYTELLCTDGTSPEALFLRTVQTLEHFHGVLWKEESRYVKKGTFKRLGKWLRNNFPDTLAHVLPDEMQRLDSQKETLLSRIGGLNNLSLQSRLEKIFRELPARERMPILDNPRNIEEFLETFLKRLVATRHYLTHFNEEKKASFKFTEQSMVNLREEGVPDGILEKLETLKNRKINTEEKLLKAVEQEIGKAQTVHYKELILKHAEKQDEIFQVSDDEGPALICWAALTFWIARHLGIDEEHAGDMALAAKEAMFLVSLQNKL